MTMAHEDLSREVAASFVGSSSVTELHKWSRTTVRRGVRT